MGEAGIGHIRKEGQRLFRGRKIVFILAQCFITQTAFEHIIFTEEKVVSKIPGERALGKGRQLNT